MFHDDYHMFFIIASNLNFFLFLSDPLRKLFREFCVCNPFRISGGKMKENV
jgi:hypothetical protein